MGQTVDLSVGQLVELRLKENGSTGFLWQVRQDGAPNCRIKEDFAEPVAVSVPAMPGRGSTHVWRIEGVRVGMCDLALIYGRPWETDKPPAQTFDVRLNITP